jgi:hypothetical protein
LKKEKNLGETVTFAMSEAASITDIRRRKDGLVRNAKAYKMPKKILGTDLCHLIEHNYHGNYQNICTHINIYIYIYINSRANYDGSRQQTIDHDIITN